MKKQILATRAGAHIYNSVQSLTKGLDISVSEYLRRLILIDLDSKGLFQEELERAVKEIGEQGGD